MSSGANAYEEYIQRAISTGKQYDDLPPRILAVLPPQEWKARVKEACIVKGMSWDLCLASTVCQEQEYYDELLKAHKGWMRMYPYHLAEYVCRVQRVTPYKYYSDVMVELLREEKSYDRLPNFTAADALRVLGIGRNEYIAAMNSLKGRRIMWRMNPGGLARDVLPPAPLPPQLQPWWRVSVVNLAESEYRELAPEEVANLKTAALPDPMRVCDLEMDIALRLYRRGLLYFDIPVHTSDCFSIPPLEGFVSNRDAQTGNAADPIEALLYKLFVASSEGLSVGDLAHILNVDTRDVQAALAIAVRLGFATRLTEAIGDARYEQALKQDGPSLIDVEDGGGGGEGAAGPGGISSDGSGLLGGMEVAGGGGGGGGGGGEGGRAVALLLDAEATSYLMMGALSPGLKRHSVTLFEAGRVSGESVMTELVRELWESYEAGQAFEGDMLKLTHFVGALAVALDAIRAGSNGRPLELLRLESLASLTPGAAAKVLHHAYCAVLPAAPLPGPPPPIVPGQPGPAYYGAAADAAGPWLQLAVYTAAKCGPVSLALARGQRLSRLPAPLASCTAALLWPWAARAGAGSDGPWAAAASAAGSENGGMVLAEAPFLLYLLNEALPHTALMVQPLDGRALLAASDALPPPPTPPTRREGEGRTRSTAPKQHPHPSAASDSMLGDEMPMVMAAASASDAASGAHAAAEVADAEAYHDPGPPPGTLFVDVPLPLEAATSTRAQAAAAAAAANVMDGGGGASASRVDDDVSYVSGVERTSSILGRHASVALPGCVRRALAELGLGACVGALRMMLLPATRPSASGSSSSGSSVSQPRWAPLSLSLGMPLQCLPLCRAVCGRATAAGFLSPEGRAAQAAGSLQLQGALERLIVQHAGGASGPAAGSAPGAAHGVREPAHNLLFDGRVLQRFEAGECCQGARVAALFD
ncbi:hypothetical protein FOA52_006088 [Chlamydomonas sp. UWO 241]|nr:hypothetical protein FOA52_006088 [Chlamydomonas sp. UWO 241]